MEGQVKISTKEYIDGKLKEADFKRITDCIFENVRLNWNERELTTDGEEVMRIVKILYPQIYADLYKRAKQEKEEYEKAKKEKEEREKADGSISGD